MNKRTHAKIIGMTENGIAINAACARLSTAEGTALEIFDKSRGPEKDRALIGKVLSSGHRTIVEHHTFAIAFDDVSVLVEQFLIEFRLASFMVKSRRYVNFGGAGYYVPEGLPSSLDKEYRRSMDQRFAEYASLTELDIPREDARFVLPYCFLSNLYMTVNARELMHIICSMLYGRGSVHAELCALGEELKAQFEEIYPGFIEKEQKRYTYAQPKVEPTIAPPRVAEGAVALIGRPENAEDLLNGQLAFAGRYTPDEIPELLRDVRPRELECLNYTFRYDDVSLSCVTHFARHRIYSPVFPAVVTALLGGGHVLPETIRANPEATKLYENAFIANARTAKTLLDAGMDAAYLPYFALSGNTVPFTMTMNARELLHFSKLRACRRAQWEIQNLARKTLLLLREEYSALFSHFGPSCLVDGVCPEGKMTCGRPFQHADDY